MSPGAGEVASRTLSAVHIGDVDSIELPYAPETFDALLASEVIEHLIDPSATLKRLAKLLKPGALVIASVPNVAHWRIVADLVRGRFDYTDWGVMDRTHLRWFTPRSFKELLEDAGIDVGYVERPGVRSKLRFLLRPVGFEHLMWVNIEARGRMRSATSMP
jgi:SAM-dependent methyltransferase